VIVGELDAQLRQCSVETLAALLSAEAGPAASSPLLPFLVEGGGQALFVAGPEPFHELDR
jgi:hypothetical protein